MRILATSDMHGNLDGISLEGIDVAIFAGDIAPLKGRGPWHVYDQIKWMRTKFKTWCEQWPNTKIVFVPGNHDFFPIARERFGAQLIGKNLSIDLPANAEMLIDKETTLTTADNEMIRIYGTPWVPIISHSWAFEQERDQLMEKFSKIPKNCDIVISHAPPHISRMETIDRSMQWGGLEAFGSCELAKYVFEQQPKMLFCGHIHTGTHEKFMLGSTECYNVSRVDEDYEIAFDPLVIDYSPISRK